MQGLRASDDGQAERQPAAEPLRPRRSGTIPITVRLDPSPCDRLKQLVPRLLTYEQSIMQPPLDSNLPVLERERMQRTETIEQSTMFQYATSGEESPRRPRHDIPAFIKPEPTIALTYCASVPMHRWLHHYSSEAGQTTPKAAS